jgi:hypothetical protein
LASVLATARQSSGVNTESSSAEVLTPTNAAKKPSSEPLARLIRHMATELGVEGVFMGLRSQLNEENVLGSAVANIKGFLRVEVVDSGAGVSKVYTT